MGNFCCSPKQKKMEYSLLPGTRIFSVYNNNKFYLASHQYYDKDKVNANSILLIVHDNWKMHGMNFDVLYSKDGIRYSYKDNVYGMKDWKLYIDKFKGENVPVFHRFNSSYFRQEKYDDNTFLIKEINSNLYLKIDNKKLRDYDKWGTSYYVGLCSDRNQASKWISFTK